MKVKRHSAPAKLSSATTAPAQKKKAPAATAAPRAQQLEAPRQSQAGKLTGVGPTNWKELAGVTQSSLLGAVSRPAQKFLERVAFIDAAVRSSKDPATAASGLLNHDARREVFRLEALLRLYKKELGEPALELVKELEDHIGAVNAFDHGKQVAIKNGAPQEVVDRIGKLQDASREAVVGLLRDKWMPGKDGHSAAVQTLTKAIAAHDFGTDAQHRADLAGRIAGQTEKLHDKLGSFSMKELEPGVHGLRRQLRWLALSMQSAGGLVQPVKTDKANAHYGPLLAASPAEKLKETLGDGLPKLRAGDRAIEVPEELYFGLQKAILELGTIKDDCEAHELMVSAGLKPAEVEKLLGPKGSEHDMTARAAKTRDEFVDAKLLEGLRRAFEDA